MFLAYVDESGDTGDPAKGGTLTYTLGCVLVDADLWPGVFDGMLDFRRRLKATYGIPMRAEIKANYLLRSNGDLRPLGLAPAIRHLVYRAHMRVLHELPVRAFAVVVDKRAGYSTPNACFDTGWEALLQRLERTSHYEKQTFALFHDEGENEAVRRWVRKARRHLPAPSAYGTGSIRNAARMLVDDPVPRKSHQSYLIQFADLVAYAAFGAHVPPGGSVARICGPDMWDEIGDATHTAVNRIRPGARPGIVVR